MHRRLGSIILAEVKVICVQIYITYDCLYYHLVAILLYIVENNFVCILDKFVSTRLQLAFKENTVFNRNLLNRIEYSLLFIV